mgnify:CR=1 FL=1
MKALTYDDIQLVPQFSTVQSRSQVNLNTRLSKNYTMDLPFIASPMDTICEFEMAKSMLCAGGTGVLHRFMSIDQQAKMCSEVNSFLYHELEGWNLSNKPTVAAVGVGDEGFERAKKLVDSRARVVLIDVAHGHHENVKYLLKRLVSYREDLVKVDPTKNFDIIAGNIATYEGAKDLIDWGADGLRVGIGGGSLCTTRIETGHGIPNITALEAVVRAAQVYDIPVMADGGIRSAGDVAKAIAVGADSVMLGSLLSGTEETPGKVIEKRGTLFKRYRGSASLETKTEHGQRQNNVEGESTVVPFKGGVTNVIIKLVDGLRSALSYTGAHNLEEYKSKSKYVAVTNAGLREANPHLIY